ncbi:MAG: MurR/RpiR family transcriptional regulator [Lachnospiraceae bacterium]|nr:MurR/RpiR family transcriptional regulator [Lachnospiraceae bacterium]
MDKATGTLAERIKESKLTKTQEKIANYFLKNQERVGKLSSQEVAQEIGVSDASIIRFSRVIGFSGYAELKDHIYGMLVDNAFSGLSLSERMDQNAGKYGNESPEKRFVEIAHRNVDNVLKYNKIEDVEDLADRIVAAERRYIVGLRGCRGIALNCSRILAFMLPSVNCITDGECASISMLQDLTDKDVFVLFVFSRYYKVDLNYLEIARGRGAYIAIVTDETAGALSSYADRIFTIPTENMAFYHSTIGATLFSDLLLNIIEKRVDCRSRIEERDEILKEQRL